MKFNKGFTLAEALITLSVIGVVGALTIPMIAQKANKTLTGPKLARVTNQVETGNQDFFAYKTEQDDRVVNYTKFSDVTNASVDDLAVFWGLTQFLGSTEINLSDYKEFEGNTSVDVIPENTSNAKSYNSKNGGYDIVFDAENLNTTNTDEDAIVINFYIDTNGNKGKPNMYGKDMFKFGLTNSGRIVPADDYAKQIVKDGYKVKYY